MSGRICCHRICAAKGNKFEADVDSFSAHLKRHHIQLAGAVSCEFFLPNGHKCPFRLFSQATAAVANTQRVAYEMALHVEEQGD